MDNNRWHLSTSEYLFPLINRNNFILGPLDVSKFQQTCGLRISFPLWHRFWICMEALFVVKLSELHENSNVTGARCYFVNLIISSDCFSILRKNLCILYTNQASLLQINSSFFLLPMMHWVRKYLSDHKIRNGRKSKKRLFNIRFRSKGSNLALGSSS